MLSFVGDSEKEIRRHNDDAAVVSRSSRLSSLLLDKCLQQDVVVSIPHGGLVLMYSHLLFLSESNQISCSPLYRLMNDSDNCPTLQSSFGDRRNMSIDKSAARHWSLWLYSRNQISWLVLGRAWTCGTIDNMCNTNSTSSC